MKHLLLAFINLLFTHSLTSQEIEHKDKKAINDMCGCFEVTFNFSETFNNSKDANYKPSKKETSKALEWVKSVENNDDKISLQHILIVNKRNKQSLVKHWRQDWMFENTEFYRYNKDNEWVFETKSEEEVKGQWTQKVYQVDDSPRYEGSGSWVHVDGKSYWESITDAPLPRREYTTRSDYNVTLRNNRQEITDFGWVHDQDNAKVIREDGKEDQIIAYEKGYNTYFRVDDSKCEKAIKWWSNNTEKWSLIRSKWDEVFSKNTNLKLKRKVDNKLMYKHLFKSEVTSQEQINKIIDSFIIL